MDFVPWGGVKIHTFRIFLGGGGYYGILLFHTFKTKKMFHTFAKNREGRGGKTKVWNNSILSFFYFFE